MNQSSSRDLPGLRYFGEWNDVPLFSSLFWYHPRVGQGVKKYFHTSNTTAFFTIKRKQYLCVGVDWLEELKRQVETTEPNVLIQNLQPFYGEFNRLKTLLMSKYDQTCEAFDDERLNREFREIVEAVHQMTPFDQYCMVAEQFYLQQLEAWLREQLEKIGESERFGEYRAMLTTPTQPSSTQLEELSLINLALQFRAAENDSVIVAEGIRTHVRNFGWLPVYLAGQGWDAAYVKKEMQQLTERDDLEARRERILQFSSIQQEAVAGVMSRLPETSEWPRVLRELAFVRNESETLVSLATLLLRPIYAELRRRMNLSEPEFTALTPEEISETFLHQKTRDILPTIRERLRGSFCLTHPEDAEIIVGEEALKLFEKMYHRPEKKLDETGTLVGACASIGQARGTVRIIKSMADAERFNPGDILVTESTCIDYVPMMRKAAAVITEMGGITSHAAIVSRELGIPCVVGVPNVQLILVDGQQIEVNAEQGMIKVI